MEPRPDRGVDRLPAAQPNSLRGHARLHHHHGGSAGLLRALPVVQAAGADEAGAQGGDSLPQVGVHLVRYRGDAARARAGAVFLLPADLDCRRGPLDRGHRGEVPRAARAAIRRRRP